MKTLSLTLISLSLFSSTLFALTLKPTLSDNSLIVYNSHLGLVHEKRKLHLKKNETQIIYADVASSINTDSVNVSLPKGVRLFSQQYRYDKLTQAKLLDAHIGKTVHAKVLKNAKDYEIIQGKLLSFQGISCLMEHKGQIISVMNNSIIFKKIPQTLLTKPSLIWNIKTQKNINSAISIDYLINQITWKSNYILNLDADEASLVGWISIDNRSGKSFTNTNLHVLAGDLNRAKQAQPNYRVMKSMAVAAYDSTEVSHQAHEGYHFYSIPFKVTLQNNETTQVKFISENSIPIKRTYTSTMRNPMYLQGQVKHDVTQSIVIKDLDVALPKGVVRTYSSLADTNILLGESNIKHTPKKTDISLKLGKNFDVKVKEKLLNHDKGNWNTDVDVEYTVKNSSDEAKQIKLFVPFNKRDGSEVKSDEQHTFTKGNIVTFIVDVQAQSSKEFKVYYRTKNKK